jgi:hypothetical protein
MACSPVMSFSAAALERRPELVQQCACKRAGLRAGTSSKDLNVCEPAQQVRSPSAKIRQRQSASHFS